MDYRHGSHTKFKIEYHFVWLTKYRYHVLQGDLSLRVRDLVRQTRERFEIQILRGVVSKDHVHILISAPPDISPSDIMRIYLIQNLQSAASAPYSVRLYRDNNLFDLPASPTKKGTGGQIYFKRQTKFFYE